MKKKIIIPILMLLAISAGAFVWILKSNPGLLIAKEEADVQIEELLPAPETDNAAVLREKVALHAVAPLAPTEMTVLQIETEPVHPVEEDTVPAFEDTTVESIPALTDSGSLTPDVGREDKKGEVSVQKDIAYGIESSNDVVAGAHGSVPFDEPVELTADIPAALGVSVPVMPGSYIVEEDIINENMAVPVFEASDDSVPATMVQTMESSGGTAGKEVVVLADIAESLPVLSEKHNAEVEAGGSDSANLTIAEEWDAAAPETLESRADTSLSYHINTTGENEPAAAGDAKSAPQYEMALLVRTEPIVLPEPQQEPVAQALKPTEGTAGNVQTDHMNSVENRGQMAAGVENADAQYEMALLVRTEPIVQPELVPDLSVRAQLGNTIPDEAGTPVPNVEVLSGLALVVAAADVREHDWSETVEPPQEAETETVVEKSKPVVHNGGDIVAVLPFNNYSDEISALAEVMPVVKQRLEGRGFNLLDENRLNDFLCQERVRTRGHVPNDIARKLKDEFDVKYLMAGSIVSFHVGEDIHVALLARLIDASNGFIVWADYVSVSADDYKGVLGLGKIDTMEDLVLNAMERLFISFSTERARSDSVRKVAVLPFLNNTKSSGAGMVTMYMFMVEMLRNGEFQPIEYGEVRNVIVKSRIRNRGELDYAKIEAFSKGLGIDGILIGTVDRYSGGLKDLTAPRVAVTARLLGTRKNKILWYNSHHINGEKKILLFDWGRVIPVDIIAHNVVSELVTSLKKTEW